jgi:ribokinase
MGNVTIVGSYIAAQVIDTDRIPSEGETVMGRNYRVTHGGKGSNMACCASRLGARSRFIGKVGRDSLGNDFVQLLERERVGAEGVLYSDALSTAVGLIVCGPGGSSIIVIDVGANGDFQPADVAAQAHIIETSDVVLSPLEIPLDTALAAAAMARNRGIPAILNPAPAMDLRGTDLHAVFALTPNESEARICLGLAPGGAAPIEDLARALLDLGPQNAIVTLGAEGAIWACGRGLRRIPALAVAVLDTVGAGDAFNAGLAVGLSEHWEIEEAIAFGIAAASLSTRKRETIESYPYRQEVDARAPEVRARIAIC